MTTAFELAGREAPAAARCSTSCDAAYLLGADHPVGAIVPWWCGDRCSPPDRTSPVLEHRQVAFEVVVGQGHRSATAPAVRSPGEVRR